MINQQTKGTRGTKNFQRELNSIRKEIIYSSTSFFLNLILEKRGQRKNLLIGIFSQALFSK